MRSDMVHFRNTRILILCWLAVAVGSYSGYAVAFESRIPYLTVFKEETRIMPNEEIRALWVVRDALTSRDRIDRLVDFSVRGRFHMLLAQVRGRGDAYYRSSIEPAAPDLVEPMSQFDPLAYLLERAHAAGLSVHAWVNVFYVWSNPDADPPADHVVRRYPEWLIADPEGFRADKREVNAWNANGVEGYFLSPDNPAVREHTVRIIEDIVSRYPVDGIHLDYIRYPAPGFGFGVEMRKDFALNWGVDPIAFGRSWQGLNDLTGDKELAILDSLIIEKRIQAVDSLVVAVREAASGVPISAAVIPDPDRARIDKGQDWVRWVQRGYVDFVIPMAYTYLPSELRRRMQIVRNLIGQDKFLVGLPLYDGRESRLGTSVSSLREAGMMGCALFSYNVIEGRRFAIQFLNEVFFGGAPEDESP